MLHDWTVPAGYRRTTFRAMDSEVVVLVPSASGHEAGVVEQLFRHWERTLSRFDSHSELSWLNARAGNTVAVSPLLRDVVRASLTAAQRTGGLFDPTVGAELAALGYDRPFATIRRGGATERTPGHRMGSWRDVRVGPLGTITMPVEMSLDLGGIAKGLAVDEAIATLQSRGVDSALVCAGGDVAVAGPLAGSNAWPIAVEDADDSITVPLVRGALATSSVEGRRWTAGEHEHHHILDPRTGRSAATTLRRVTVAAAGCAEAEVHAKVAIILGAEQGGRWLEDEGYAALLVAEQRSHAVGPWPVRKPVVA
jgi:FAD:protein FMN transferase